MSSTDRSTYIDDAELRELLDRASAMSEGEVVTEAKARDVALPLGAGPIPATEKALAQAGLSIDDIGAFEINEAFAVQVLAFLEHFGISDDDPRVNPYGGAIAMGHPLASSGVRLMNQLARQFEERPEVRYGITTMCIGIGMGGTVIWENPHWTGATDEKGAA